MICHVVLIRLDSTVTPDETESFLERAKEVVGTIPGVQNLRVGTGLGMKADVSYPIALVMDFEDDTALDAYQVHPDHQRFVREIVGPLEDDKQVYDYRF